MATQKERFLKYLQTCVKSTRASENNPLHLGGNAPKDYTRFLESDRLFDYNPSKWTHLGSMYDINDADKAMEVFNALVADEDFVKRDKNDNQGWRRGAISHYVCFLNAQEFFCQRNESTPEVSSSRKSPLKEPLQKIVYGAPGTGKSFGTDGEIKKIYPTKDDEKGYVYRTTFHPDSDYSTFVGCYKPTKGEKLPVYGFDSVGNTVKAEDPKGTVISRQEITYDFVAQSFTKAYIKAWMTLLGNETLTDKDGKEFTKPVFLIIEEINRGNCAQIFGDLFQLLDRDEEGFSTYPIKPDADLGHYIRDEFAKMGLSSSAYPTVVSGEELILPNNLYIWATMNTSDQSLFPIDSAFKRRWDWKYVPISNKKEENYKIVAFMKDEKDEKMYKYSFDWWKFLEKVNEAIDEATSSEDKKLGYFFCKGDKQKEISADKFVSKVLFYLWTDVFKDYEADEVKFTHEGKDYELLKYKLNESDTERTQKFTFPKFFDTKGDANEEMVVKFLTNIEVDYDRKEVEDGGSDEEGAATGTFQE